MNVLDLFSGIGGFSLGLERAGMRTAAFCEIEPYARAVLAKHWPGVPCYPDVRELTAARLASDGIAVDVMCGGFPCQDISLVGNGAGLAGARSGLWREYARLVGELRPRFVIVENVSALLGRGLGEVLGDLAALGFDAEWHCIPASAIGAPHQRDRIWIIAYPNTDGERREEQPQSNSETVAGRETGKPGSNVNGFCDDVANTGRALLEERHSRDRDGGRRPIIKYLGRAQGQWSVEPDVGRVANGIPARVDRLRCLGNSVVPQIVEEIGRAIMLSV